jgi:FKBP-type peptidyl-prolyl cis-trans isomerase FklB
MHWPVTAATRKIRPVRAARPVNRDCRFAQPTRQWDNAFMQKTIVMAAILLAAGVCLPGRAAARQASSAPAPAAKTQQAPAAKTHPAPAAKASSTTAPKTQREKASYAIGLNIGKGMHRDGVDVDPNMLLRGIKDGMAGAKPLLTDDEAKAALTALQNDVRQKHEAMMQQAGDTNKKQGDAFLAANKTKPGVVTLPSGLQYKILKEGTGPKPSATDTVVCNYRGTFLDNTEFDSSAKHGQPATFEVGRVIKGWTEALQLMPVGSKWQLFIPSDLAYGPRGAGTDIGPNATLIFDVELLSIKGK